MAISSIPKDMKWNYKNRLFFIFFFILLLFAGGVVFFEQSRERKERSRFLENKLEGYADLINKGLLLRSEGGEVSLFLDSINLLLPDAIRITFINREGEVLYDNVLKEDQLINHIKRPEIQQAAGEGTGREIRTSDTNHQMYFYFAKSYPQYYIRLALPYDTDIKNLMQTDKVFFYYVGFLFIAILFLVYYASNRFNASIQRLRKFSQAVEAGQVTFVPTDFPSDELGEIGTRIANSYKQLEQSKQRAALEREKLLQHIQSSQEGLCFYTPTREVEFMNGLFVQYLNVLIDEAGVKTLFSNPLFADVTAFLNSKEEGNTFFSTKIEKQGRWFEVRVNVFTSGEFELVINEITGQEKIQQLKHEMTGNIAHELRTPVTSIRGYLETVLEQNPPEEKRRYFLQRAYNQTLTLSELIQDMGLITKLENASQTFSKEPISLIEVLEDLTLDFESELKKHHINFTWSFSKYILVKGNYSLLYAIFRNLLENSIRYGGDHINVRVHLYAQNDNFYYFSFSDDGVGLPSEANLNRLFERFYRVSEGRTRESGGTGLGLSIVRNAILFHQGNIIAKHRKEGGLELFFNLPKA